MKILFFCYIIGKIDEKGIIMSKPETNNDNSRIMTGNVPKFKTDEFPVVDRSDEDGDDERMSIMGKDVTSERFPLSKKQSDEYEEPVFDIMGTDESEDIFSLKPEPNPPLELEVHKKTPPRTKQSAVIKITAFAVCLILLGILVWIESGILHSGERNAELYSAFLSGESMKDINPDFDFFMSIEGTEITVPVVKSNKKMPFTTFDGSFLYPGSITASRSKKHVMVTGNTNTLWDISEKELLGKKIILENEDEKAEYEIIRAHTCEHTFDHIDNDKDTLTVFVEKNGIFAIHAERK